jgi:hypothetical protein
MQLGPHLVRIPLDTCPHLEFRTVGRVPVCYIYTEVALPDSEAVECP